MVTLLIIIYQLMVPIEKKKGDSLNEINLFGNFCYTA